jgi:hypothetical protein
MVIRVVYQPFGPVKALTYGNDIAASLTLITGITGCSIWPCGQHKVARPHLRL